MTKRNLALLYFTVRSNFASNPLRKGAHQVIYTYLKNSMKNKELDDLEVAAIDKENNSTLDPMSADKWLQWWEHFILPVLLENDFSDDLMIEYPGASTDLTEL